MLALSAEYGPDFILLESGGDNLAANFSRELADFIIYVIDVCGGDKIPRKGGPGVTQADLLIINKVELAEAVGASLEVWRYPRPMSTYPRPTFGLSSIQRRSSACSQQTPRRATLAGDGAGRQEAARAGRY